jgi:hypothetical protein
MNLCRTEGRNEARFSGVAATHIASAAVKRTGSAGAATGAREIPTPNVQKGAREATSLKKNATVL